MYTPHSQAIPHAIFLQLFSKPCDAQSSVLVGGEMIKELEVSMQSGPQCKLLLLKPLATTKEGERELSYMSEYLSSIQHMDMGPYRIVAYSSQKTWTRLIMNC